ncbi:MAG: phospholipid carrier-dependent glycosyltransferase [Chloroflexi bacterium]|nr:phospholipid carrier-dependent glycosyltransferase [Chloroflexota bacterium]
MTKMTFSPKKILALDVLVLVLLTCYILAGVEKVPFHGDESTIIWMSADFDTVVLKGDISAVTYSPPSRRTTEQHLRILNGTLTRWVMGSAWYIAGFDRQDLNDQWVWGPDMEWNRANGHRPSDRLLKTTRLASAGFLVVSVALVLAMTRLVAHQVFSNPLISAIAGWLSASLYALNPVVLMNGRRAMFEGPMLFGLALVGWAVLRLVNRSSSGKSYLLIGVTAGIALSTKHSAAFTIALLFFGLGLAEWSKLKTQIILKLGLASMTTLLIFLALTPLWWSKYLPDMPHIVLDERQKLLDEQVVLFGGYEGWGERLEGLWRGTFGVEPQYYEADYWSDYVGVSEENRQYENSHLAGITSPVFVGIRFLLAVVGLSSVGLGWRQDGKSRIVGLWMIGILLLSWLTIPLDWQRYYLPIQTPLALVMGLGGAAILQTILYRRSSKHGVV